MHELGYHNHAQTIDVGVGPQRRRVYHPNLERLICAAVSNARFAALLVEAPAQALAQFQVGRDLSASECRMVLSISGAADIAEFAGRLLALVNEVRSAPADESAAELSNLQAHNGQWTTKQLQVFHERASHLSGNTSRAR